MPSLPERIRFIDTHTAGEPTRILLDLPFVPPAPGVAACRAALTAEHDWLRRAAVCEPRGGDVMVGALLCPPADATCVAGVVFFNNVGCLGMCGHGTIGVVVALRRLGRIGPGPQRIETPVGVVAVELEPDGRVSVENVRSFRHRRAVELDVPGVGRVIGDVAFGGNWFFLCDHVDPPIDRVHAAELTARCLRIRTALRDAGVCGEGGAEIDHVELCGPPRRPHTDGRNFVLCPGGAYDRSPCGTGTSARLACLAAEGSLAEGAVWRQESIVGGVFEGHYRRTADGIIPTICGSAFVNAEGALLFDPSDPFATGLAD